jgi:putative transcriptional regulator
MNKEILINQVICILEQSGFIVSERCNIRPRSFDIAARHNEQLLLIKVLSNIDGLKEDTAQEMMYLAEYLEGSVLLVGEKTRDQPLEPTVVYYRYGIPSVNIDTIFDYFIEELPPVVYAAPGGLYVSVDGSVLREQRTRKKLSIGAMASDLGLSRRTISKYEEEGMDMSVDMVIKIEEMFNTGIALAIDFLNVKNSKVKSGTHPVEKEPGTIIRTILSNLGIEVIPISQAPFSAVSFEHRESINQDNEVKILTGFSEYSGAMMKRAKLMSSISEVTNTHSMVIVNGHCRSEMVENTVIVEKKKLDTMNDFLDLMTFISNKVEKT